MPLLKIDKKDLAGAAPIAPDWYKFKITEFTVKPSKAGDSQNLVYIAEIQDGVMKGRVVKDNFNSKAYGLMVPFLEAVYGVKIDLAQNLDVDTDEIQGKLVWGQLKNEAYEGRLLNRITNWSNIEKDPNDLPNF